MQSNSFPTPHTCRYCEKLVLDMSQADSLNASDVHDREYGQAIVDWLTRKLPARTELSKHHPRFIHGKVLFDFTLAEVRKAAKERCSLCISVLGDGSLIRENKDNKEDNSLLAAEIYGDRVYFGVPRVEQKDKIYHVHVGPFRGGSSHPFQLVTTPENVASKDISVRPINITPASAETFSLTQGWLQTCLKTHIGCPMPREDFMPSRLIEILQKGGRRYLCLRETISATKAEPYAALSYCWGGEQHVTTNTKTIRRHLTRINMQDLPNTLRDAILVTEKLGIQKVWIDALCIIQDDVYDKAIEIAQMPLVYSNASVTITASRATSAKEGFLQERLCMANETPDLVFKLPYRCRGGEIGSVVLIPPIKEGVEPLDRRAWSLQERILSPRILEYGSLQLRWICHGIPDNKVLTDGFKNHDIFNNERSDNIFKTTSQLVISNRDPLTMKTIDSIEKSLKQWYGLVNAYTHRKLTLPDDRILAISGIASQFGRVFRDDYCAGLWKSDLLRGLFWRVQSQSQLAPRPSKYQGPSWSWTAINSPTIFESRNSDIDSCFEILDCKTKPQDQGVRFSSYSDIKYGAVESGLLTVKGRIMPAEWLRSNGTSMKSQSHLLRVSGTEDQANILPATIFPDALEEEHVNRELGTISIYLLNVHVSFRQMNREGLMLRRKDKNEYTRLGIFWLDSAWLQKKAYKPRGSQNLRYREVLDLFDHCELQTITIT